MTKSDKPKTDSKKYRVLVDDNFHYMDESERYTSGEYDTAEEAIAKCKEIVDDYIDDAAKKADSAAELYDSYVSFGEDPYIEGPTDVDFSAWDYAKERSEQIFIAKISQNDTDVPQFTLNDAIKLAEEKHKGQVDKGGEPYISHPLSVMGMLKDEPSKMAGVLHDIVEDTTVTFDDLKGLGCPEEVLSAVRLVTHAEDFDGSDESYMRDIQNIADSGNQIAVDVKWADLTNNQDLSRIPSPTPKDHARLIRYSKAKTVLKPLVSDYLTRL
jgi:GTP diphosphokinase / guanosine-3',5'-bis(diphosphate) 3'-diphosphatase